MRSFNMGRFGSSDDPWFRVGDVDVNTTTLVTGIGVFSMLVWAIEGPSRSISKWLWLSSSEFTGFTGGSVSGGQIWRLVTWPLANEPDIWGIITLAIFFLLGSQLEAAMGRRQYTMYLLMMTIIPAVIVTVFELLTSTPGLIFGIRDLEFGVFVGFALRYPTARFWPGIPAWGMAALFIGLQFLRVLGNRNWLGLVMLIAVVGTSAVSLRSLGFAEDADFIPKVPLPSSMTGMTAPSKPARGGSTTRRKRRSRAKLAAVPPPTNAPRKELSKLEEAEMDAILDQVSEHGMDSLTPEQRARLEAHSKRLRRRDS